MGASLRRPCQPRGVMSPASPESTLGSAILPWRMHSCGQKIYTFSVHRRKRHAAEFRPFVMNLSLQTPREFTRELCFTLIHAIKDL